MIGDLIGRPGRLALEALLPDLRRERDIDFVTANGENVAGGMGLTASTAEAMFHAGVDVITSGNHIWDKREMYEQLEHDERILRPHNYGTRRRPGPRLGRLPRQRRHRGRGPQLPGPHVHDPHRQPVHRVRPPARRGLRTAAARSHRGLPLRAHQREVRLRHLPRRPSQRGHGHPHPRPHGRRADHAQGHGLPVRPRAWWGRSTA